MFPKKGNSFPNGAGNGGSRQKYAEAIAAALRMELGGSHQAVKTVMRWTGANERTVKNWLAGKIGPRGEHLVNLIRHSNGVLEIVLRMAGREQIIATKMLLDARNILGKIVELMDAPINRSSPPR